MCGIAGLIHRGRSGDVGREMTAMLQALRHRGPDSAGFALYGRADPDHYVMRFKVAEQEDLAKGFHIHHEMRERKAAVDARLAEMGAAMAHEDQATEYAHRYVFGFDGDMKRLADYIEDIEAVEILSIGHALELIKDLGDANRVSAQYGLGGFKGSHGIGHMSELVHAHGPSHLQFRPPTLSRCSQNDASWVVDPQADSVGAIAERGVPSPPLHRTFPKQLIEVRFDLLPAITEPLEPQQQPSEQRRTGPVRRHHAPLSSIIRQICSLTRRSSRSFRIPTGVTSYSRLRLPPRCGVTSPTVERSSPFPSSRPSAA